MFSFIELINIAYIPISVVKTSHSIIIFVDHVYISILIWEMVDTCGNIIDYACMITV